MNPGRFVPRCCYHSQVLARARAGRRGGGRSVPFGKPADGRAPSTAAVLLAFVCCVVLCTAERVALLTCTGTGDSPPLPRVACGGRRSEECCRGLCAPGASPSFLGRGQGREHSGLARGPGRRRSPLPSELSAFGLGGCVAVNSLCEFVICLFPWEKVG